MTRTCLNRALLLACVAAIAAVPLAADAHRAWLLPSATVLSGGDNWVTVDAAVSNDLFYFEHMPFRIQGFPQIQIARRGGPMGGGPMGGGPMGGGPMGGGQAGGGPPGGGGAPMARLVVTAPDLSAVEPQNKSVGRYRATFDVELAKPGTYRIAALSDGMFATWKEAGQTRRWRGTEETFAKDVPAKAEDLRVTEARGRIEVFVTAGAPTRDVLKPAGKGLELDPITHPNDLFVGETARFRLLLDGKPASGVKVTIIPGGIRYRQNLQETTLESGADGEFSVRWPEPGMYWINASVQDEDASATPGQPRRRFNYAATLEVLSP